MIKSVTQSSLHSQGGISQNNKNGHTTVKSMGHINVGSAVRGGHSAMSRQGGKAAGKMRHFSKVAIHNAAHKSGEIGGLVSHHNK